MVEEEVVEMEEEEEEDHLLKVFNVLNVAALIMLPLAQVINHQVLIMGVEVEVEGEQNEPLLQTVVEDQVKVAFSAIIVVDLIMHQLARTRDKYSYI